MEQDSKETGCCPKFDKSIWDGKIFEWHNKSFIKKAIPTFLHMPWPPMVGKTITQMWAQAQKAGAEVALKDFIVMANDPTLFKSEFYMTVTKEVPGAQNMEISGTFAAKVFDGPYGSEPKWIKETEQYLSQQGKKAKKYYFYYTTCPKCAKFYGHNYVVVFAEI